MDNFEKPLVSVVTFTRNRGDLLRRCIKSVLSQTYINIEHIVVDGASTDNTDDVIKEFTDDRLRFIKLETRWPQQTAAEYLRNISKGKYLAFLDSDDEYAPTKIEKQVALIESLTDDYGFVYCWMSYFDSSDNNKIVNQHCSTLRGFVKDEVLKGPLVSGTPSLLFRKDFFIQLGGWKSANEVGIASDWEMCARACQTSKVDYVPEALVNVYINHGGKRQSETSKYYDGACERVIKFHQYFIDEFEENFKRRPDLLVSHYQSISINYFRMKNIEKDCITFLKLFKVILLN